MGALLAPSGARNLQRLTGVDQIRIFDDVLVGLVDAAPLGGVAVFSFGDLRQTVAFHDNVGAAARHAGGACGHGRAGRRGRAAALYVREVWLRLGYVALAVKNAHTNSFVT